MGGHRVETDARTIGAKERSEGARVRSVKATRTATVSRVGWDARLEKWPLVCS